MSNKLTSDNGYRIINIDISRSMFQEKSFVKRDGTIIRPIDTEVLTHITLEKSKVTGLMPVMNFIAKDWGLNLSKEHDKIVAKRILINSIKKN